MRRFHVMPVMIAAICSALASAGWSADKDDEDNPTFKVVLHPAAAARPALRYQLLPPLVDRRPGNAVTQYLKAPHEYAKMYSDTKFWDMLDQWMVMPLPELRTHAAKEYGWLTNPIGDPPNDILDQIDRGARCESCDWAMPIHEYDFDRIFLAEIQDSREPARLLGARARLQIADGKFDEALRTLQTGYAMGRHVAQGPFVVQCLVGAAISGMMSKQVETFIEQPGAPNLYWALASLPVPLADCRIAFEAEVAKAYLAYPELRDLDKKHYPPEQWQQLLEQTVDRWRGLTSKDYSGKPLTEVEHRQMLQTFLAKLPEAKKWLIAKGRSAAEVEAMPTAQAVLLYAMQTYDQNRDELLKWLWMPYRQARQKLEEAKEQLSAGGSADQFLSMAGYVGGLVAVKRASGRVDRSIAGLEILEAIRIYGAGHDGRLPDSLKDITEVPIPIDPLSGEPFQYHRDGDTATLESAPAELTGNIPFRTLRYEIRFEKAAGN